MSDQKQSPAERAAEAERTMVNDLLRPLSQRLKLGVTDLAADEGSREVVADWLRARRDEVRSQIATELAMFASAMARRAQALQPPGERIATAVAAVGRKQ